MEKHFEATQSRIDAAKAEGNLARSQEASAVAAFTGGIVGVLLVLEPLASAARAAIVASAAGAGPSGALGICGLMLVPMATAASAGMGISLLQSGGLRFVTVGVKFEKLNPVEGLKRMFSREAVLHAVRASAAFGCAALAIAPSVGQVLGSTLGGSGGIDELANAAWIGGLRVIAVVAGVAGCFAAVDYGVTLANWRKKLRMSHEEIKRDQKEHGGDPLTRSRRRAMHRALSREAAVRVRDAAFVVTNPTHIAIALEYRPPEVAVPRVLVRAADQAAARVRELASEYRIPMIENIPLARALYSTSRPGDSIPIETYLAVAEIVAALVRTGVLGE